MRGRSFLAYAISISVLEQVLLLLVLLVVLPYAGIVVPSWVVISSVAILATISIVLTRLNLRTLGLKVTRSPDVGVRARVVKALTPRGYVRVGGELWPATSESGVVLEGEEVRVLRMEGLRLIVGPLDDTERDV